MGLFELLASREEKKVIKQQNVFIIGRVIQPSLHIRRYERLIFIRYRQIKEVFLSHLDTEEPDSVRKEETNGQTMASASSSSDLTNEDTPFLRDTTPFQKGHLNDVNSRFCRLL